MALTNSGSNVVVSGINNTLTTLPTNIKLQDNCLYTVTNNTNGFIVRLTNNITVNRDDGYYIPIMILNNGEFKTVKMNSSKISLSLPKYTELEVDLSPDTISAVMSAINSSLNSNFKFVHDKLELTNNKLNSLDHINDEVTKISAIKRKTEGTKIS